MDDAKARGRIAALEMLVVALTKAAVRDSAQRNSLRTDLDQLSGATPPWLDHGTEEGQEAATHYRTALLELGGLLGPNHPRS